MRNALVALLFAWSLGAQAQPVFVASDSTLPLAL